jgi:hypothetical protein
MGNPAYPLELFRRVVTVSLETMPGRNGTWLSGFAIFFAVGDFLEFVAEFDQKLVCFGSAFLGSWLLPFQPKRKCSARMISESDSGLYSPQSDRWGNCQEGYPGLEC